MDRIVYCKKHDSIDPSHPMDGSVCRSCHKDIDSSHFVLCEKCSYTHSCCIMCGRSVDRAEWEARKKHLRDFGERKAAVKRYWKAYCIVHMIEDPGNDRDLRAWKSAMPRRLDDYAKTGIRVDEKFRRFHFQYPPYEF